jgi:hypothetical protein
LALSWNSESGEPRAGRGVFMLRLLHLQRQPRVCVSVALQAPLRGASSLAASVSPAASSQRRQCGRTGRRSLAASAWAARRADRDPGLLLPLQPWLSRIPRTFTHNSGHGEEACPHVRLGSKPNQKHAGCRHRPRRNQRRQGVERDQGSNHEIRDHRSDTAATACDSAPRTMRVQPSIAAARQRS